MTEDEKTEPTEETGAATDKAADSTDAQTQTEAKADAEAPEIETPETGAPKQRRPQNKKTTGRKQKPPRRLKTALPKPMTSCCARLRSWKTRGGAPTGTAPRL